LGHQSRTASIAGRIRGRIGSFADQVYPVYAFAKFAQAFGSREALNRATQCAETICRHQGSSGQWWWHYDAATGKVAGQYPVFSVHQDGMAPMSLYALTEAGGREYDPEIQRGLQWIEHNELGRDLRDNGHVIWRSIFRAKHQARINELGRLLGLKDDVLNGRTGLSVCRECRPYELGWALYALAQRGL
jgi:hypothetical protein